MNTSYSDGLYRCRDCGAEWNVWSSAFMLEHQCNGKFTYRENLNIETVKEIYGVQESKK